MMTVRKVSELTGVSIRALHYYDDIGLFRPSEVTDSGYRLYCEADLERLQCILLFRELEFPLKEIKRILDSPDFDRGAALEQQINLLEMKKEHIQNLIDLARGIKMTGVKKLDFTAFDTRKIDEYARRAEELWGTTPEYREYGEKSAGRTKEEERKAGVELIGIIAGFGKMLGLDPAGETAQKQVKKLQGHISRHYYTCSDAILLSLGKMYAGGGDFTANIDGAGGEGTAEFACRAIEAHCNNA